MTELSFREAGKRAVLEEMRTDSRVFVMGQDIRMNLYADSVQRFDTERIRDVPICETGFFGAAIGAALTGMRPVVESAFSPFLYSAMDQIANQAAKSRYMFGGQASVPIVVRSTVAYGIGSAAHHSDRPWGIFAQVPGLKIVVPTTPYEVNGLLRAAIRDGNPVICFHDMSLAAMRSDVPEGDHTVPIGVADVKRVGSDITVVALAASVHHSLQVAAELANEWISLEVIDVRTVTPLDRRTIMDSVKKTGRLIVVDPAPGFCSVASEIAAMVAEDLFEYLKAPPMRLTAPHVPVPFAPELERLMYPAGRSIADAARKLCRRTIHRKIDAAELMVGFNR